MLVLVNVIVYIVMAEYSNCEVDMTSSLKVAAFFTVIFFTLLFSACKDAKSEVDDLSDEVLTESDEDVVDEVDKMDTDETVDAATDEVTDENNDDSIEEQEDEYSDESDDEVLDEITDEQSDETDDSDSISVEIPDSEMVTISSGSFMMGCQSGDTLCYENGEEEPLHEVTLSSFKIDKYEVITADYKKCIAAGVCNNLNEDEPHYIVAEPEGYYTNNCSINSPDWDEDELSVNCISWFGAKAYCEWVGRKLPTEAQWEYAASGTANTLYTWGNESPSCSYTMMYDTVSSKSGCGTESMAKPGEYLNDVSPFGVFDMAGNLTEWVSDYYKIDYYSQSPQNDPLGPETGSYKIFRGGFWGGSDPATFRNSARPYLPPETALSMHGFRCAK